MLAELTFTGYYPAVPWLAYLLVGLALGRLDLAVASYGARCWHRRERCSRSPPPRSRGR